MKRCCGRPFLCFDPLIKCITKPLKRILCFEEALQLGLKSPSNYSHWCNWSLMESQLCGNNRWIYAAVSRPSWQTERCLGQRSAWGSQTGRTWIDETEERVVGREAAVPLQPPVGAPTRPLDGQHVRFDGALSAARIWSPLKTVHLIYSVNISFLLSTHQHHMYYSNIFHNHSPHCFRSISGPSKCNKKLGNGVITMPDH